MSHGSRARERQRRARQKGEFAPSEQHRVGVHEKSVGGISIELQKIPGAVGYRINGAEMIASSEAREILEGQEDWITAYLQKMGEPPFRNRIPRAETKQENETVPFGLPIEKGEIIPGLPKPRDFRDVPLTPHSLLVGGILSNVKECGLCGNPPALLFLKADTISVRCDEHPEDGDLPVARIRAAKPKLIDVKDELCKLGCANGCADPVVAFSVVNESLGLTYCAECAKDRTTSAKIMYFANDESA